jgi:hypothetical protein
MAKLVGLAGIIEPFEKAQEVLEQYLLVSVSPNTIRKETQRIGTKQEQKEAQWIQQSQDPAYLRKQDRTVKNRPKRLYGSIDGAYVPVKKEWKEAKTVSWYEAYTPYGRDTLRAKDIFYYTSLEQAEEFGKLMWGSGVHHHAHLAQEVVFVCDGASWIWKLVDFYFPQATQILDWYHACEYLYPIAEALHDPESEEYVRWVEAKKEALWAGQVKAVIRALKRLVDHPQAGEDARKAVTYYGNNQSRMDYARYCAEGYFIGSGTVESACKQIVSMRLKCPGARWSQEGALATAKARTSWLNGQLDQTSALPLAV